MNSALALLTSYFVNSVWEITVIGGAGWLLSRSVKRLGSQAQHLIWVAALVLAIVAPAVPLYFMLVDAVQPPSNLQEHSVMMAATASAGVFPAHSGIALPSSVMLLLSLVYSGAVVLFAIRLGWLLYRTMAVIRRAAPVTLGRECEQLWQQSTRALGVENALLLRSAEVSSPVTAGFFNPILLVSMNFADGCTAADFLAAVGHECVHIKRRDFQKNVLYEAIALLISYHPVAWMIKSQLSQTREMICDSIASEKLLSPHKYAQSLIRLATSLPSRPRPVTSHAVGIFNANTLEERIMTLRTKRQPVGAALKICLTTCASFLLVLVATVSGTLGRPVEAQTPPFSTKLDSVKKSHKHKKLECTFYDPQGIGYDGTCGTAKSNRKDYRCFLNSNKSVSQPQIGCAGKVNR